MPTHATRLVWNPFSQEDIPIDEELATLVESIWQRGIRTASSCQEDRHWPHQQGKAYIVFETIVDAERFLEIAAGDLDDELESLYNRAIFNGSQIELENDWYRTRRFVVEAWAADANRDAVEDDTGAEVHLQYGPTKVNLSLAVYLPRSDIPELEQRFGHAYD